MATRKGLTVGSSHMRLRVAECSFCGAETKTSENPSHGSMVRGLYGDVILSEHGKKATADRMNVIPSWKTSRQRRLLPLHYHALQEYPASTRNQQHDSVGDDTVHVSTDQGYIVIQMGGSRKPSLKPRHIEADNWLMWDDATRSADHSSELSRTRPVVEYTPQIQRPQVEVARTEDDAPVQRVERLLAIAQGSSNQHIVLDDVAYALKNLSKIESVRHKLWEYLEPSTHPQLRWLIIETLAKFEWGKLASYVVEGIKQWDASRERTALLGAVIAARNNKVPLHLHKKLFVSLRKRLQSADGRALSGDDPEQTELVCNFIDTFRFFATSGDMAFLSRYWEHDCAFPVRLRAIEAATHVASRFAPNSEVAQFFHAEAQTIGQHLVSLTRERLVAVENGTLLRKIIALLLARLGEEAKVVLEAAKVYPDLRVKATSLLEQSETTLTRYGHKTWLIAQQGVIKSIRSELNNLASTK